jgi:hypothetical protein
VCLQKKTNKFVAQQPAFTPGDTKSQLTENKHVIKRKLAVAPQLPIGDDVSAYTRCKAACPSFLAIRKQTTLTGEARSVIVRGGTSHMTPRMHPFNLSSHAVCFRNRRTGKKPQRSAAVCPFNPCCDGVGFVLMTITAPPWAKLRLLSAG